MINLARVIHCSLTCYFLVTKNWSSNGCSAVCYASLWRSCCLFSI